LYKEAPCFRRGPFACCFCLKLSVRFGIPLGPYWEDVRLDPQLLQHRRKLVREAARTLDRAKMVRFDERSGQLYQTEAGRIASHFYIRQASMEIFDELLKRHMSLPEVLHMVRPHTAFKQYPILDVASIIYFEQTVTRTRANAWCLLIHAEASLPL